MCKGVGVCFADFIFIGYLKTGDGKGGSRETPLDPSLMCC